MRQDDLDVGQLRHPVRIPLEGNVTVIVYGTERVHQLLHGQRALPDQLRDVLSVLFAVIMQMHVPDVGAEVGDRGLRLLSRLRHSPVHIPDRGQVVVGEIVEQVSELAGVGKGARGLDEQRHGAVAHDIQELPDGGLARVKALFLRVKADELYPEIHRRAEAIGEFAQEQIRGEIKAGDRQTLADQVAARRGRKLRVRGTPLALEQSAGNIV